VDGLTGEEGSTTSRTKGEREVRALKEQQATGVLNRAAAICLAFGVFCLFFGVAICFTDTSTLGVNSPLAEATDWFGTALVGGFHIVLGVAMVLAVQKRSRLIVALATAILTFSSWATLAVLPTMLGDAPGVSPTGIAVWGWFAGMCSYSLYKVVRLDRDFAELWGDQ
jgi:uncharacterized membrane protein